MKNKRKNNILRSSIVFAIVFAFLGVVFAYSSIKITMPEIGEKQRASEDVIENNLAIQKTLTNEQRAIREVADAYYRRGENAQYGEQVSLFYAPEEATSQHRIYSTCSRYSFQVYYQAFGMKIIQPTTAILAYADKYYDINNITTNDVIEYWKMTQDSNGNRVYKDNAGNLKNIDLLTEKGRKEYATKILKEYNLQVGDLISYHTDDRNDTGHTLLVYDILYDENGEPIDALIRESNSNFEKETTKITSGLTYSKLLNENTNVYEGTFKEFYLVNDYKFSGAITRKPLLYNSRNKSYFTILRPLLKDEDGNYTGKYYNATFQSSSNALSYICLSRTLDEYHITESTLSRIEHSGIKIDKTVDKFYNNTVNLGDTLEYTIKIENCSNNPYNKFSVVENISEKVEIIESSEGILKNNAIVWNIECLEPKEIIEIKYKVKIKNDYSLLGEEIISTGTVADIPSAVIKNSISTSLTQNQKMCISKKVQSLIGSNEYYGQELISKAYNEISQIKLNLNEFDITDLIKVVDGIIYYPKTSTKSPKVYLNEENAFFDMVLNNYFGAVFTYDTGTVSLKRWENIDSFGSRDPRADTVYKEHFQTGDILVYKNSQQANSNVLYETENGIYYLIYISEEDKIVVSGKELYGFIGVNQDGKINNIYRDEADYETNLDYSITDLRTLLGKDYYVVFRPSMTVDITPMKLTVNYSDTNPTNQDVTVTIISNEEMLKAEGWNLSEDKLTLTKTFNQNTTEELKLYDYGGNARTVTIKIENIDKRKPIAQVKYSKSEQTLNDVIVTIEANEELQGIEGWELSNEKKFLSKTYTQYSEETITIYDLAGNSTNVIIEPKKLTKIEVTTGPTKTEYIEGESFDQRGMKVVAIYNDTISKEITDYVITDGNNLSVGKTSVTISYTEGNITKMVEQQINVLAKLRVDFEDYNELSETGKKYVENVGPKTTLGEFIAKINTNGRVQIFKDDIEITNNEAKISTGMKVKISLNNEIIEYTIAVKGDCNGDGDSDIKDLLQVNKHRLNKTQLEDEYLLAGDVNKDNKIDIKDILQINKFRLGKIQML